VTLGLNGNEANILSRIFDLPVTVAAALLDEVQAQARALQAVLGISRVVIHRSAYAVSVTASESFSTKGPYCHKPLKNTGAGDRFNAGFCLGLALEMDDESSLALGCATAGLFVRYARSANRDELVQFIRQWANGGSA
jgi:sugar/nucleoside kinase (ribokinase family)